jgi:hypothetical protein
MQLDYQRGNGIFGSNIKQSWVHIGAERAEAADCGKTDWVRMRFRISKQRICYYAS